MFLSKVTFIVFKVGNRFIISIICDLILWFKNIFFDILAYYYFKNMKVISKRYIKTTNSIQYPPTHTISIIDII